MPIWLLLQDPHYEGNWRVLGAYASQIAAEAAHALLKSAEAPGEMRIEQRTVEH